MAAVTATTYEYGGAQQGYNPYDAYSHGGASAYQWPQPNAVPAQPQQAKAAPQVLLATPFQILQGQTCFVALFAREKPVACAGAYFFATSLPDPLRTIVVVALLAQEHIFLQPLLTVLVLCCRADPLGYATAVRATGTATDLGSSRSARAKGAVGSTAAARAVGSADSAECRLGTRCVRTAGAVGASDTSAGRSWPRCTSFF